MNKKDVLFWIFAFIEAIGISILTLDFFMQGNTYYTMIYILFIISIIGIEYLIYSKK